MVDYVSYFLPFLTEWGRCGSRAGRLCGAVSFEHDLTFSSQNWCRFMYNFLIDFPLIFCEGRCGSGRGRLWGAHQGSSTNQLFRDWSRHSGTKQLDPLSHLIKFNPNFCAHPHLDKDCRNPFHTPKTPPQLQREREPPPVHTNSRESEKRNEEKSRRENHKIAVSCIIEIKNLNKNIARVQNCR